MSTVIVLENAKGEGEAYHIQSVGEFVVVTVVELQSPNTYERKSLGNVRSIEYVAA